MAAYLDSSAFDHLYRKVGCTAADIQNLRNKIYGRELSLLLSIHTLEEILLDTRARPEARVARVKLTLSLANFRRMVKPFDQLLADDIRSYAQTGQAARPFIDATLQNVISDGLGDLVETDGEELDEDMIAALKQARDNKQGFVVPASPELATITEKLSFDDYLRVHADGVAREIASRAGVLAAIENRSLDDFLRIPSVWMAVGITLSFAYGGTVDKPAKVDPRGILHAVCAASSAETLVTSDELLSKIVRRVPMDNFEVIDLPTFLRRIA